MSRAKHVIVASLIALAGATLIGQTSTAADVCFVTADSKTVCVPIAIMRATFATYAPGQPPPTFALEQELINTQAQLVELLRQKRECDGQLGPLQSKQHNDQLRQQQDALGQRLAAAAPDGMTWDNEQRKYIAKPNEKKGPIK